MALINNLDLQVQLFTPAIAHTQVDRRRGAVRSGLPRKSEWRNQPNAARAR